jgi:hypothetical protein
MILRVDKDEKSKILKLTNNQYFHPDSYYIWIYQVRLGGVGRTFKLYNL